MANRSALPDADTTQAAIRYIKDLKSSDPKIGRDAVINALWETYSLYHIEADAVLQESGVKLEGK